MRRRPHLKARGAVLIAVSLLFAGCGRRPQEEAASAPAPAPATEAANPLYVDPASRDFSSNPKLLERILQSPHGYFRFINVPFSEEVCRRFSAELEGAPALNLHGDAHIEQYAVTDLGRGLTDFDDSSIGPALIDLLRLGVSLRLAARQQGFAEASESLVDELLRGYLAALEDPTIEVAEPALARRKREKFRNDTEGFFTFVDSVMEPMTAAEKEELEAALVDYFEAMVRDHPDLGKEFFQVTGMGYLRQGIGSALDLKFLIRLRGPSDDPLDDVVLEAKEVRDLTGIDCIRVTSPDDPLRVLVGHARIAYEPFRFLGYARLRSHNFWVHAWVENYSELKIEEVPSAEELAEVVHDVAVQLGRGHTTEVAGPVELQLRRDLARRIKGEAERIHSGCRELEKLVLDAWEQFVTAAGEG